MKGFSTLSDAKIRVKTIHIADILQVMYLKIEEHWLPIQLIPQFSFQERPTKSVITNVNPSNEFLQTKRGENL